MLCTAFLLSALELRIKRNKCHAVKKCPLHYGSVNP